MDPDTEVGNETAQQEVCCLWPCRDHIHGDREGRSWPKLECASFTLEKSAGLGFTYCALLDSHCTLHVEQQEPLELRCNYYMFTIQFTEAGMVEQVVVYECVECRGNGQPGEKCWPRSEISMEFLILTTMGEA